MRHIEILLEYEESTRDIFGGNIRFDRVSDDTLVVSCSGYKHMDLYEVSEKILKLGCRYDFSKPFDDFDKTSGRTYVYFKEPKRKIA